VPLKMFGLMKAECEVENITRGTLSFIQLLGCWCG